MATQNQTPVWELSKENAAPLQRGRNVAALEHALAETEETRAVKERALDRYERLVRPSEQEDYDADNHDTVSSAANDPLLHWLAYIKFHQESFPTNTHEQFLLMERCFRAMSRFRRYANDVRFIRLCCQYAEKTERPNEIFKYLYQHKIGIETAIYWIAWGFVAEKREEWAFANDIYTKGIRKKAKPIEKLNKRYQQFQRRMARHWLNATQTQDDDDNVQANNHRGVLGSLTEDAVQRNDRSESHRPGPSFFARSRGDTAQQNNQSTFVDLSAPNRTANSSASNNPTAAGSAFPIFVEDGGETSGNPLNDSMAQEDVPYRQLERENERKKENVHTAERWNERGAYAPTYERSRSAAPKPRAAVPPPFAVYVDEECAEQQRREEAEQARQHEAHRRARDERTFRDREDLCSAESLVKDPLRYVRDPAQLHMDQRAKNSSAEGSRDNTKDAKRKANAGFSTRMLRHPDTGEEQSFEEARALVGYFKLVPSSTNFNRLVVTPESSDNMSVEEGSEEDDVSMTDSLSGRPPAGRAFGHRRKSLMIPLTRSTDLITPRNASTASSTTEEAGNENLEPGDPTINTKIAMQELSMMFSSPAIGLNDSVSAALNRSGGLGPILNESGVSEHADDGSMAAIVEEKAADEKEFVVLDEGAQDSRPVAFSVYEEAAADTKPKYTGFAIYSDNQEEPLSQSPKSGPGFSIYTEEQSSKSATFGLMSSGTFGSENKTHQSEAESKKASGFSIADNDSEKEKSLVSHANEDKGDNAATVESIDLDLFNNEMKDGKKRKSDRNEDDGADTATFSLFDEAMELLDDGISGRRSSEYVNSRLSKRRKSSAFAKSIELTDSFGDISCIMPLEDQTATLEGVFRADQEPTIQYQEQHKEDIQSAIHRLFTRSVPFPKNRKSLEKILTTKNFVSNMPSYCLPSELRLRDKSKMVPSGTEIAFGRSTTSVRQELGRGAYGCVLLLESEGHTPGSMAALKAQSPVGSLAWEFEVLERLHARLRKGPRVSEQSPFPAPLSYVSLADGAFLTMEAVSTSGLNLIDLINAHRQYRGEPALPEILALHYVSRMLDVLEKLHWFGHILHCDTKADNWVLSSSALIDGRTIEASDLMLTDFGRAIDLEALDSSGQNPLGVRLKGKASRDDMMCVAMKKDLPWSFDIDTYGLCDTAHILLFGCNLELVRNEDGRWGPKKKLRRYHQANLWTNLFDCLLNLDDSNGIAAGSRPCSLRQLRAKFEEYLKSNEAPLKAQLKHQATFLPAKRPDA